MHVVRKRVFVGNLPPHVQENDIREQFGLYGNVVSVEIKHRKDSLNEETSPVFAFVSIETDDNTLHTCFQEISNYDWHGYYVKLQLAKESFLEKLKREREETQGKTPAAPASTPKPVEKPVPVVTKKVCTSSESDSDSSEEEIKKAPIKLKTQKPKDDSSSSDSSSSEEETPKIKSTKTQIELEDDSDEDNKLVIKNNKHKVLNGKLQIESVSSTPINLIAPKTQTAEPKDAKSLAADEKRKKSLVQMKQTYNQQKFAIQNALSSIDVLPKNKIIFDDQQSSNERNTPDDVYDTYSKKNKVNLFENDEYDEENYNFEVKKQFEGKKGQKLLELQSRYTNDRRFTLDSRFLDEDPDQYPPEDENDERDQQFDILESVLGKKLKKIPKNERDRNIPQPMLRFDPSKPEHSKFELKRAEKSNAKPVRKKNQELELKTQEPLIEVSKETFYKVTENLKESLQENKGFSLLNMYGRAEEKDDDMEMSQSEELKPKQFDHGRNPFKYDSSDTEDDEEERKKRKVEKKPVVAIGSWREGFFFAGEDKRLQDGLNFLKKLGDETKDSFSDTRRELKQIIRSKVRNNQRNSRPFRKKLGRNKMIKARNAKKQ